MSERREPRLRLAGSALVGLLLFGLWSAGRLVWAHHRSGEACPVLGGVVPACYVALGGYLLMAAGLGATRFAAGRAPRRIFWLGLFVAGGLALVGSAFEALAGDVCPRAFGWLPMCYVSLAVSVVMGVLYVQAREAGATG